MIESTSLASDDFTLDEFWQSRIAKSGVNKWLSIIPGQIIWKLSGPQREMLWELWVLKKIFSRNAIEWCWRSSLGITWIPFTPTRIEQWWNQICLKWHFTNYLDGSIAHFALGKWSKIWRLLVNLNLFSQDIDEEYLYRKLREDINCWFIIPEWSKVVRFRDIKDNTWKDLFPEEWENCFGLEIPLIDAYAKYHKKLLKSSKFLSQVVSQWRNAINELTNWHIPSDWKWLFIEPLSLFLWWIDIVLSDVSAIIKKKLTPSGVIHIDARFLDQWRSGWSLNILGSQIQNAKYLELYNFRNQEVTLSWWKVYLKIWNIYPKWIEWPMAVRGVQQMQYDWLHSILPIENAKNILNKVWENIESNKPYSIIIYNGEVYSIPWEDNLKFQWNTIEYLEELWDKMESKWANSWLNSIAKSIKTTFWNEHESRIAFFHALPPIEIILKLKSKWIKQIVVHDMQLKESAFYPYVSDNNAHNYHNAMKVTDAYNLTELTAKWEISIHRIRRWSLETYRHMLWWTYESFRRLQTEWMKERPWKLVISIYSWSWNDTEITADEYFPIFDQLNKLMPWQVISINGGWPWWMWWCTKAASRAWCQTIWVWSNLSSEQTTNQSPDLSLILEWNNRGERQTIMSKMLNLNIVDLRNRSSTWTIWELINEITWTCLFERPLTPIYILWNTKNNVVAKLMSELFDYIVENNLYKWNFDLEKLLIFCDDLWILTKEIVEFATSPKAWYDKVWIDPELVEEWKKKRNMPKSIHFPIRNEFSY